MSEIISGHLAGNGEAVGVIMAGGSGTRFWPLSRSNFPKQFLPLTGSDRSLIQATADRLVPVTGKGCILVVTADNQKQLVKEQIPSAVVLAEPCPRNTAACLGFAAVTVLDAVGDVPMICLPADHMIWGEEELRNIFNAALKIAGSKDVLITIGIRPTSPETGYGYIMRGVEHHGAYKVEKFVEKPDLATAKGYLQSGKYFWNSGMFVWRPSVILEAIANHLPELYAGLERVRPLIKERGSIAALSPIYSALQSVSVDVGILEKAENVLMIPGDSFSWSDVGSWNSWAEVEQSRLGEEENFIEADAILVGSERCAVLGNRDKAKRKFIAGVGLADIIVVETDDAFLICHREHSQDVKKVVEQLKDKNRSKLL